jgi:hypothetical protein
MILMSKVSINKHRISISASSFVFSCISRVKMSLLYIGIVAMVTD